jgi:potassium-transporting ATPase potassium-binding subunit
MNYILLQDAIFIAILILFSIPLGLYIAKVMRGEKVFLSRFLQPVENGIYRLMGIGGDNEMSAKEYALSVLAFSAIGLVFVFAIQLLQGILPLNQAHLSSVNWQLAFNTAASFVSNTNWQAYAGESTMTYLTQSLGLTVQNFVSAATGIAVVFALIRGFARRKQKTIGSFWHDLIRSVLYILLPLSALLAVVLVSQGVVQTLNPYKLITTLESGVKMILPLGPAASQIAIKQLGTNGGGFFGMNSAYPFENPTILSNLLQLLSILLLPAALCVSFGKAVNDMKQGRTIYIVMLILFIGAVTAVTFSEQIGVVVKSVVGFGNMEGKEIIHGIGSSSLWATATTAASNGSVNAMLDSFTPLAGMVLMFLMQLGEIVFGGIGSGLYGMIVFVILTVFIAGLMVGRTPEYLSKKIEPFDMKMVCIIVLTPLILTLMGTATAVMLPQIASWLTNTGAHGFSEVLYAFSSIGNNNGSAFAGYMANTGFTNLVGGAIMLITRFLPMVAAIFLAGNLANKKTVAAGEGTLSTSNAMFIGLLIVVIFIIGALSFLPALSLGPIAEFFSVVR